MIQKFLFSDVMKRCFKCLVEKPTTDFYRHPRMADGFLGKCIECTKLDTRKNCEMKHDYYLQYDRNRANLPKRVSLRKSYAQTIRGSKTHAKSLMRQRIQSPEKYKARYALTNAIRDGRVVRGVCAVCGSSQVEGHHHDYSKPLDVVWLCKKHHTEHHQQEKSRWATPAASRPPGETPRSGKDSGPGIG